MDNTAISTQLNSQSPAALAAEELISELQKHIGHHNALYGTQFKGAVQVEGMENPEDDGLYGINVYASPMPQNWDWEIFILWFDNIILFTKITADIYKAEANEQTLIESGASSFDTSIGHTYIQNVHAQSHQLDYTEITGTNGWNEPFTPAWVNHPYYSDPNEGEGSNEPSRELTLRLVPLNPIPPLEGFLGDMNGDSFINVLDIVIVVQTILGSEVFGEGYGMLDYDNYPPHFDFNQDGFLNILDIVSLVNFILEDG